MKIQSSIDWLERLRVDQTKAEPAPAAAGFGELLKTRLSDGAGPSASETAGPVGALTVQFLPQGPPPADSVMVQMEGFLDLMEEYRRGLVDPTVSLKALDPLVGALERRCEALAGSLPEDTGLQNIVRQALVESELEIMRFRRGDYLPA